MSKKEGLVLFSIDDAYYNLNYAKLYLSSPDDEVIVYKKEEDGKIFFNMAIKRAIKSIGNVILDDIYYDLETPYGYGGFYTNTDDEEFLRKALKEYTEFCNSKEIIAEFIRFHPLNTFPKKFSKYLDFCLYDRDVVFVDLNVGKEERWASYSSNTRYKIKKARHLEFKVFDSVSDDDIFNFYKIYIQTMNKNSADKFYFFSEKYFKDLLSLKNTKLFLAFDDNHTVVSGAIFIESEFLVSYHLGAKNYNINIVGSNYFLFDRIFDFYSEQGKLYALLGGGRTSNPDDSLLKFKRKFSKITKPFYIGGKIYNKDIYNKLCSIKNFNNNRFLRYRYD